MLLITTAAVVAPATSYGAVAVVDIEVAPPPLQVEVVPAPRAGYAWAPGFWHWENGQHVWIAGRWIKERPGYTYVPATWVQVGPRWHFVKGHWAPR
jgi:hypothetical protein